MLILNGLTRSSVGKSEGLNVEGLADPKKEDSDGAASKGELPVPVDPGPIKRG